MIMCKNCGKVIESPSHSSHVERLKAKFEFEQGYIPEILKTIYDRLHIAYNCDCCGYPFDYKDLSMEDFWGWLKYSSEHGDSRKDSFKAILRYFDMAE